MAAWLVPEAVRLEVDMKSPHIATAVAIGYVLGRSKKMKLAITIGGLMAGRRMGGSGSVVEQGAKLVGGSQLSKLTGEIRERLADAAREAAVAAVTHKIDEVGQNLSRRASGIRSGADTTARRAKEAPEESDRELEEGRERDEEREEEAEPESGTPERSAERRSGSSGRTRSGSATRSASRAGGARTGGTSASRSSASRSGAKQKSTRARSSGTSRKSGTSRGGDDG